jgi:hypothetical protein
MNPNISDLIAEAAVFARPIKTSEHCEAGGVAALIVSESGRHYTGGLRGFCLQHGFLCRTRGGGGHAQTSRIKNFVRGGGLVERRGDSALWSLPRNDVATERRQP